MYKVERLISLASRVREVVNKTAGTIKGRAVNGFSVGGDAQFDIDNIAETILRTIVEKEFPECFLFTEDYKSSDYANKKYLMVIDPIDGTRAAAAGLEMSTIAIALADLSSENLTLKDIKQAFLLELRSGAWVYADHVNKGIIYNGFSNVLPNLNQTAKIENMFWTFELNGHPSKLIMNACGHIIDATANKGGVFIFNSATYSILKIITGQLDAYVDIGNRILKDKPSLLGEFEKVGNGKVLHLFPYDIAAISFIAQKAGVIITDAYGNSLNSTKLTDLSWQNQQSCIAASTQELHQSLMHHIRYL